MLQELTYNKIAKTAGRILIPYIWTSLTVIDPGMISRDHFLFDKFHNLKICYLFQKTTVISQG